MDQPVALRDASGGAIAPIRVETSAGAAVTAETLRFDAGPGADARTVAFFSGRIAAVKVTFYPAPRNRGGWGRRRLHRRTILASLRGSLDEFRLRLLDHVGGDLVF